MLNKINIKIIIINACLLYKMFYICTSDGNGPIVGKAARAKYLKLETN